MSDNWELVYSEQFYEDMREAASYMRDRLKNPKAARDFVAEAKVQALSLATFPEGQALVADYELARRGYRWCPVGNFMMFYIADPKTRKVLIERLLYGARDWKSLL